MSDPKMREDFEAWACSHEVYEDDGERLPMTRLSGCYYEHVQTQAAWEAWQASRDALAAQRDEGLAREAELREQLAAETGYYRSTLRNVLKDNQGVVFETPVLCRSCQQYTSSRDHFDEAGKCKARPGCADGEKAE